MSKRRTANARGTLEELGSSRWTEREGRQVLAAWRQSGLSASAFGRLHGMSPQRLSWWRKRLGDWSANTKTSKSASIISWVPAEVRANTAASVATLLTVLRLPCGVSIEFADASALSPAWVASLVSSLSRGT